MSKIAAGNLNFPVCLHFIFKIMLQGCYIQYYC